MSDRPSATILEFRRPAPALVPVALAPADNTLTEDPQQRLARAFAALDKALAEQREAVSDWRAALGQLHGSMNGLADSLGGYNARLGKLAEEVGAVNQQARALEAWADGVLAEHPPQAT
jgi:chromosome segregation ATPase